MGKTRFERLHSNAARSTLLHDLRERPRLLSENDPWSQSRDLICRLKPPGGTRGSQKRRPRPQSIVYLYGDERRAIRMFIEVNTAYVESCVTDGLSNPLQHNWDPIMYQMLLEEWDFHQAELEMEAEQ